MTEAESERYSDASTRRAWIVFAIVYLGSIVAPFNQFKVPPLIPVLLADLHLTEVQAGLLMSVFSVSGLLLALPAGYLFRRFGPRAVGTLAVASSGIGSLIGAVSPDPTVLLFGRLVEGTGMGLIAVFALVTIAAWFPEERRDLPMAIYTTWIPVGQILIFTLAPLIYTHAGWRAVWWVGAIVAFVCAALFAAVVRLPAGSEMARPSVESPSFAQLFHEPGPWLLAAFFGTFHIARAAFGTWAPTYLVQSAGWRLGDASATVSLFYLASIPAALPGGWLITRLGSRKVSYIAATLVGLPAYGFAFSIDPALISLACIWAGVCAAVVPTAVNAATPETVSDRSLTGPAAGAVNLGRNAGQLLAPILVAPIVQAGLPWPLVGALIVAVSLIGLLAGVRIRERRPISA